MMNIILDLELNCFQEIMMSNLVKVNIMLISLIGNRLKFIGRMSNMLKVLLKNYQIIIKLVIMIISLIFIKLKRKWKTHIIHLVQLNWMIIKTNNWCNSLNTLLKRIIITLVSVWLLMNSKGIFFVA